MAVLEVSIPTGYIIQQQVLDAYVRSRITRNLQRARFQPQKVIFYFDWLDNEDTCVNFTIERWYPVANMSRYLPIRIYDYYAPGKIMWFKVTGEESLKLILFSAQTSSIRNGKLICAHQTSNLRIYYQKSFRKFI